MLLTDYDHWLCQTDEDQALEPEDEGDASYDAEKDERS